jgi:hypothetical protein
METMVVIKQTFMMAGGSELTGRRSVDGAPIPVRLSEVHQGKTGSDPSLR